MSKNIFKFVSLFFFLMLVSFSQNSYAQLSGSYTIPGTPFASVKAAFDSLNLVGVGGGGVTFNVTAGYTESVSDSSFILTATGTVANPIIFQKSGVGANPLITRTDAGTKTPTVLGAQGDAVIIIQGSDYVTFDGIDVAATFSSTATTGIEYGYFLRKVDGTNGCKYVAIKNSVIDMTKGTSGFVVGIYSSNLVAGSPLNLATGVTVTNTGGKNEFVTLTGNTIQDVHAGIIARGFNHTTAPYDLLDSDFIVGTSGQGNTIQNYGGGSATLTYGVYMVSVANATVSYNSINNVAGGGVNATQTLYGIFFDATQSAIPEGIIVMNNNNITLGISTTQAIQAININATGTSLAINDNTFSIGSFTSTAASYLINISRNTPIITITGNQNSGTITKTGASGTFTCINYGGSPATSTEVVANNTFSNISLTGTSGFTGISLSASTGTTRQFYNNTISDITSGSGTTYGMQIATALTQQIYNNTIRNISSTGFTLAGFFISAGNNGTASCYKNQVYNVSSTNATTSTQVNGIQLNSGLSLYVYNNFISDIKVPSTTSTGNALFGINASASNATNKFYIYFNTIFLNSTGASTYRSFGIFSNTGSTSELKNNIVVNTSTGNPVAYGRSSTALGTYSAASDNNDFFATNIFWDGTNYYPTLNAYKAFVYPKDQASFSENPPFINAATAPYDLHIQTGVATQTESGGRTVSTPVAITDDFDGNSRNTWPDVGADEFSGISLDLTAPIISYTPFDNTSSLSDRTLVVNVTDQAGVPTTAPGWPNLYWKRNAGGTYTAVQPTGVSGSNYTFNFGSGVVPGDTVYYFVVARDTVPTAPNLRAFPTIGAGSYTFDPPAAGIPPTTPYSYRVTNTSLSGDYTVGTASFSQVTGRTITFEKSGDKIVAMENGQRYYGDLYVKKVEHPEYDYPDGTDGIYLTLSAAIADLNLRGVSGPVNFLLTDASYTAATGEVFPYVVNITNEYKPTSTNTVTIKPNTGVTSLIQGAVANSFIFKIVSNYVKIDGSNSGGTDRSLTIQNTSTTFPLVVLFGSIGTTSRTGGSIKNCKVINGTNSPTTALTPAIFVGDSTVIPSASTYTAGYFTNIAVQNNSISKSALGIQVSAIVVSGNGNGLLIDGNSLNDTTVNSIGNIGIQLLGVDGASITNNNIGNIITPVSGGSIPTGIAIASQTRNSTISNNIIGPIRFTATSSGPVGISINTGNANSSLIVSNNIISGLGNNSPVIVQGIQLSGLTGGVLISKNRIYDIKNTNVSATGYGAYAISLGSSLTAANITLANNFIWDVAAYGRASQDFHNGYGIYITGGGGYNLYHNTISLTTEQTLATGLPACINITSSVTTANSLDIRNNIFYNSQTVGTDRYAIICKAPASVFAYIDNNDYYTTGPNLGYFNTANVLDLAAWKTATGKDVNSISANPQLVSANDLHVNTNYDIVDGKGFYLATVPQDIDGDTRNNPSDIGADEYTFTPPADPTDVMAAAISASQIDVTFTPNVDSNNVVIVWNLTGLFSTPSGTPPAVDSAFAGGTVLYNGITSPVNHTGLVPSTVYYYKLFSYRDAYYSTGVAVSDTTLSVQNPSAVTATALNASQINVAFTPNTSNDSVIVVFNYWGTFETPSGPPPAIGDPFAGGTLLANTTTSPYSHIGLDPNTPVYYKLFSYNGTFYSSGVEVNATTLVPPPGEAYTYDGAFGRYGTVNLTTGVFTNWNFKPQGSLYYPVTADNDTLNSQFAIMADYALANYYLMHINFITLTGDSIAPVGPFAIGQTAIKGMSYNAVTDTWYVISSNDLGTAAYLYTLNIATGVLTVVGQIQNANNPAGIAINCDGNAYIINVVGVTSTNAVLNSLNLTTAVATAVGTNLGLPDVFASAHGLDFNPTNGNLYWSAPYSGGFFNFGSFRLVDITTGTSTEILPLGMFEWYASFNVNGFCELPTTFQLSVNVTNGWNIVSIPGLHPVDQNVNTWWQYRDLGADVFKYLGGYQAVTTATPGTGYWMKHSGDRTYNTGEEWPVGGIQLVTHDPLTGASGWNLIGGYELSVAAANVTTNPPGLQSGPIYKYSGGYQVATTIDPGYGYWMKLNSAGQIIIPETIAKGTENVEYFSEDWGRIILKDAAGINYTLYAVKGETDLSLYELPPAPPSGMVDIRFNSGRIAEDINSSVKTIDMNGITYPLTVRVEGMDIRLMDETGKDINVNLKSGEDVVISDATIQKLMVSGELIPDVYALEQNYPNPFNPSTVIEFSLPENVGNVQLSIYNALGEKVAELVNTALTAGKYQYQWNAQNVATGMYIYELRTDKFVSVKKMMLLK